MNLVQRTGIEHAVGAHFAVSHQKRERILDELVLIFYLHGGTETKGIATDITKEINGRIEHDYLYTPKELGLDIELEEEMVKHYAGPGINKRVVEKESINSLFWEEP